MESTKEVNPTTPIDSVVIEDITGRPLLFRDIDETGEENWYQLFYPELQTRARFQSWPLKNFVYEDKQGGCPPGRELREGPWVKVGSHDDPFTPDRVDLWLSLSTGDHHTVEV